MRHILSAILVFLSFSCISGKHQITRQESFGKDSLSIHYFQQKEKAELLNSLISSTLEIHHIRFSLPDSMGQQFIEDYTALTGQKDQIRSHKNHETQIEKESISQSQNVHFQTQTSKKSLQINVCKGLLIIGIFCLLLWRKGKIKNRS